MSAFPTWEIQRAEIIRLQAEIERLRTQCGGNCRYWEGRWRDEKTEIERLKAALHEIAANGLDHASVKVAMAALAGKEGE